MNLRTALACGVLLWTAAAVAGGPGDGGQRPVVLLVSFGDDPVTPAGACMPDVRIALARLPVRQQVVTLPFVDGLDARKRAADAAMRRWGADAALFYQVGRYVAVETAAEGLLGYHVRLLYGAGEASLCDPVVEVAAMQLEMLLEAGKLRRRGAGPRAVPPRRPPVPYGSVGVAYRTSLWGSDGPWQHAVDLTLALQSAVTGLGVYLGAAPAAPVTVEAEGISVAIQAFSLGMGASWTSHPAQVMIAGRIGVFAVRRRARADSADPAWESAGAVRHWDFEVGAAADVLWCPLRAVCAVTGPRMAIRLDKVVYEATPVARWGGDWWRVVPGWGMGVRFLFVSSTDLRSSRPPMR